MSDELSPSQAARRIGATTRTVQRWIVAGRLPARRVGGRWRVASDVIDAFDQTAAHIPVPGRRNRRLEAVFVANRGEIADRIARTCQRLGIRVVRLDDGSADRPHFLDREGLVASALAGGADALHPGYGFLAEDPDFADLVERSGLTWIGPPPSAMRRLGDKAAARQLARDLSVPVAPGYDGSDQRDDRLQFEAERIGLPLLVKPAAGGGGKGMRVVREEADLASSIAAARQEGRTAFGDGRLILEGLIEGTRHVEVQLLFDGFGQGVSLGDRDCSIQRRHQKILEETPAPNLGDDLRGQLADAAMALGRAAGYTSAGTVEFLVDDRGRYFFLEANTRLQVEHPITEEVIGRDLVADQLRIAAGERLSLRQVDIELDGHALEARLYAEDPENGFLPTGGRVVRLRLPSGEGIRIDAALAEGLEVGSRFDPLLAKIIAHGPDRRTALDRLAVALEQTVVLGFPTNLRFLRWLVGQPFVAAGRARTDTLDRFWPPDELTEWATPPAELWRLAASALVRRAWPSVWGGGWRLNGEPTLRIVCDGALRSEKSGIGSASVVDSDQEVVVTDGAAFLDDRGRSLEFRTAPPPDVATAVRAARGTSRGSPGPSEVVAPMPGQVVAVHVKIGAEVNAGDPLVTLEAMKMEHIVAAPSAASVVAIATAPGRSVSRGEVLVELGG